MLNSKLAKCLLYGMSVGIASMVATNIAQAGCGCTFVENASKKSNQILEDGFFWSNMDYTRAKIYLGGKYVDLRLTSSKDPKRDFKGAKSVQTYKSLIGNLDVRIEKIATNVCKKSDIECESIGYDAVITINEYNRMQKFRTSGDCGC